MISGHGSVTRAVDAMKAGAYSFIEKPVEPDVLLAMMKKALERLRLSDENQRLRAQLKGRDRFGDIVGSSEKMQQLFQLIGLAAPTDANILIHGESERGRSWWPRRSTSTANAPMGLSSGSTARLSRRISSVGSSSATRRARSPVRARTRSDCTARRRRISAAR